MDDIKRASKRRFERALNEASWDARIQGDATNSVAMWLYSVNPQKGARLLTQMSVEGYRQACNPSNVPAKTGLEPWNVLSSVLEVYDKIEDLDGRLKKHEELACALIYYASNTRTWACLPKVGEVPGIHLVVADWMTKSGTRVFRPMAIVSASVLTPAMLADAFSTVLEMHLSKNPNEAPVLQ